MTTVVPPRSHGAAQIREGHSFATRRFLLPTQSYIHTESLGGLILLFAGVTAMVLANSTWGEAYFAFWHTTMTLDLNWFALQENLHHIVNDVLMTIFFFVVGLEIKRELVRGYLSELRKAALPIVAALGGMVVPAGIYLIFNAKGAAENGWGIPMATDIAFSLGILTLLGRRIPIEAKIFLLALAIADDIGAILVIALFYSSGLSFASLAMAIVILFLILAIKHLQFSDFGPYVFMGVLFWMAVYNSGIHATIAGVVLGLMAPARAYFSREEFNKSVRRLLEDYQAALKNHDEISAENALGQLEELTRHTEPPLDRLVRLLHPWSNFVILPIFALANAGVALSSDAVKTAMRSPVTLGVALGLVIGKLFGILGCSWLAIRFRLVEKPESVSWRHITGVALLGGVGFTVSLFISGLAFTDGLFEPQAKMGIIAGSLFAGVAGYLFLRLMTKEGAEGSCPKEIGVQGTNHRISGSGMPPTL